MERSAEIRCIASWKTPVFIGLPIALAFFSLFFGRMNIPPDTVLKVLGQRFLFLPIDQSWTDIAEAIIIRVRLPRTIVAIAVGAGLSISGAAFQGMFHNPLVSPYILGVSAGAGFGAALGIILEFPGWALQVLAFLGAVTAVGLAYFTSRIYKTTPILMLVLSGIVVGTFFQALISGMQFIADTEDKLPAIVFWLLGGLDSVRLEDLPVTLGFVGMGVIGLLAVRWKVNVLSMGDQEAKALGVNTEFIKLYIIVCVTIISAGIVSFCGIIGWVGLVIPHVCRMLFGPDHRVLLPATLVVGASYLLLIDNVARMLSPAEIPLGILTSFIGAPFFAFLLRKTRGGWG